MGCQKVFSWNTSKRDADAFDEHGFDLLIDEESECEGIYHSFGVRRQTGWLKIMERSLLDDEYIIQSRYGCFACRTSSRVFNSQKNPFPKILIRK